MTSSSSISRVAVIGGGIFGVSTAVNLARRGVVPVFGSGEWLTNPIHEADLARAAAQAVTDHSPGLTELPLGGPEVFTRKQIAEMAFAGEVGAELTLVGLAKQSGLIDSSKLLFSESNTRFVVEVVPSKATQFEAAFAGLPLTLIGKTVAQQVLTIDSSLGSRIVQSELGTLKAAWQKPLAWG